MSDTIPFIETIGEIYALMPDSILFGSTVLYFLTQNLSFGVFAIFIIEIIVSHRFISWFLSESDGSVSGSHKNISCRAGFKTPQVRAERMFTHDPYPSFSIFSVTSIATYLGLSVSEFDDTLKKMGDQWVLHTQLSKIFIVLTVFGYAIMRYVSGCDTSISEIMISGVLAVIVGILFFYLNKKLFGLEGINFLGLPYYDLASADGSPIYTCGTV